MRATIPRRRERYNQMMGPGAPTNGGGFAPRVTTRQLFLYGGQGGAPEYAGRPSGCRRVRRCRTWVAAV